MDWPGEKALIKLGDLVSEGTGGAFAPWQTRRKARAEAEAKREELLMLAQTEQDIEDIKSGKKQYTADHQLITVCQEEEDEPLGGTTELKGGRVEPYFDLEALDRQANARKQAQVIQEEINLTKTVLLAEQELESGKYEANDDPVDPDWFTRWRDSAEKVSNEELRKLWAKALAGEVTTPGSYSLRTLEFLKNLSQLEAEKISKLAPYVLGDFIYKSRCLETSGLSFGVLLEIEELGIITGLTAGGLSKTTRSLDSENFVQTIQYGGKILIIKNDNPERTIKLGGYKVTKLGEEILKLGVFPYDYNYLEELGNSLKKQNFTVTMADISRLTPGEVHYVNARDL
ncbi:DUF2806 domain-containing protein [Vibrio parahaemolyticus]|uniref:DUF2806 domain-containing protein n=1 Tax=Vibrio TaxID=662 RepID=UPI00111025C7|nr:DUF2806 domain-containing protein [Vibrio parahaemolyticus]MDF4877145.1 DUF2806 domain-containing protein [Vibrio parahaemolyticus]MDF5388902.1 DUF2806 domain-containing protein [Vibrio parahaemolyticus]MDF5394781.1 DUF2806 domain-containing protein [Vibrio parahaemolyticus]QRH14120.1 DUF2806 domain-containing protein [Vibrio parahaemolyticus]TMX35070.1 hypothetical protein DA098_21560 [Vibrio parahaemolyticus]